MVKAYEESIFFVLLNFINILRFVWIISLQKAFKPAHAIKEGRGIGNAAFPFLFFYHQLVFLRPYLTSSRSNMVGNFLKDIKQGIIRIISKYHLAKAKSTFLVC